MQRIPDREDGILFFIFGVLLLAHIKSGGFFSAVISDIRRKIKESLERKLAGLKIRNTKAQNGETNESVRWIDRCYAMLSITLDAWKGLQGMHFTHIERKGRSGKHKASETNSFVWREFLRFSLQAASHLHWKEAQRFMGSGFTCF